MGLAVVVPLPFDLFARILGFVGRDRLITHHEGSGRSLLTAASGVELATHVAAGVVSIYGLSLVAALPSTTRTRGLVRAAQVLSVVALAKPFLANLAMVLFVRAHGASYALVSALNLGFVAIDWVIAAALGVVLVKLLGRLSTALDVARPRGLVGLVALGLGLRVVAPITSLVAVAGLATLGIAVSFVEMFFWVVVSVGWWRAFRRVAAAVEVQTAPE